MILTQISIISFLQIYRFSKNIEWELLSGSLKAKEATFRQPLSIIVNLKQDYFFFPAFLSDFLSAFFAVFAFPGAESDSLIAAWAAAKRAIGTRNGEQLT